MSSRLRPLGELIESFDSVRKPVKEIDRHPGPYPYYGATGVIDCVDDYLLDGEYLLVAEDGENLRTRKMPIAFLTRGKFWVNNHAHVIRANDESNTRFLMYAIESSSVTGYLTGSTMPKLTQANLHRLPVPAPPLPEQRAIAEVLGALDDKIELNERMNATLDEMARALFNSWFVDFDPVRAKAEGRQPSHMDAATAALFPDSFEDSALGPIPAGWRVSTVGEVAESVRDGVKPADVEPGTAYVGLEHIPRRSLALSDWGDVESVTSGKVRFRQGDILFGRLRPYFAKVVVAAMDGVCSSDIVVCRPRHPSFLGIVATQLADDAFIDYTDAASTGTKMPRVSWEDMSRYPMALPADALIEKFNTLVEPWFSLMRVNIHESRTLAGLRDALLPRLISGEIRVGDAARAAEVAV